MSFDELLEAFYSDVNDSAIPHLTSKANVSRYLNEAEEEACIRANLLFDQTTPAVCEIAITAGTSVYKIHTAILNITKAYFMSTGGTEVELCIIDRLELDRRSKGWRRETGEPRYLIQDDTRIQLGCIPSTAGTLRIECYRLPLKKIEDADKPEIHRAHHRHLVKWVSHRAYATPDSELFDPTRSARSLAEFEKEFGYHPSAHLKRNFETVTAMRNQVY